MAANLYMDVHVQSAITRGLRLRGVDVLTAQQDESTEWTDVDLLERATDLERVLFTRDDDFLGEATRRQAEQRACASVAYAHQQGATIGQCVGDLELIAKTFAPGDLRGRFERYWPKRRIGCARVA
jgi:predicted nuclease of predicted toxin-antitoxin system